MRPGRDRRRRSNSAPRPADRARSGHHTAVQRSTLPGHRSTLPGHKCVARTAEPVRLCARWAARPLPAAPSPRPGPTSTAGCPGRRVDRRFARFTGHFTALEQITGRMLDAIEHDVAGPIRTSRAARCTSIAARGRAAGRGGAAARLARRTSTTSAWTMPREPCCRLRRRWCAAAGPRRSPAPIAIRPRPARLPRHAVRRRRDGAVRPARRSRRRGGHRAGHGCGAGGARVFC
jgi:hypothetical protein